MHSAGPADRVPLLLLRLCVNALNATAVLTPAETARITAAVDAVAELAVVQLAMRQVLYPASDAAAVFEKSQWLPKIDAKA